MSGDCGLDFLECSFGHFLASYAHVQVDETRGGRPDVLYIYD